MSIEIEVDRVEPVFVWFWDSECEYCPICRTIMMNPCVICQTKLENDSQPPGCRKASCAISWGKCKHAFHKCCIGQWVAKNQKCPLCQQPWIEDKVSQIS